MSGLEASAADTQDAIKLMRTAYVAYKNDELLGGALQVVIATRFGFEFVDNGGQIGMSSRPERPVRGLRSHDPPRLRGPVGHCPSERVPTGNRA
jgi:hypothetical protein